jgi:hypothetical protein
MYSSHREDFDERAANNGLKDAVGQLSFPFDLFAGTMSSRSRLVNAFISSTQSFPPLQSLHVEPSSKANRGVSLAINDPTNQ